jgi:transposase InsO family protein
MATVTLHKNARTTPAIRREIQQSKLSERALARKFGLNRATVHKWKYRDTVEDMPTTPKTIHATMSPEEEWIAVELRTLLLLPLDDLLDVIRRFINPGVSRSGLHRCLRRHGVSNIKDIREALEEDDTENKRSKTKAFKDYEPGYIHADVKYLPKMPDESRHKYLFVAIDRASRWVFVKVTASKSAQTARRFLEELIEAAPFKVTKVLTDNGKEFTDRFCATGDRKPTGRHPFDKACAEHDIEHRLIRPRHPQTNGMVERFNGRVKEVIDQTRFGSTKELRDTLYQYCRIYNHHIPQRNLGHITPVEALKKWQKTHPHIFKKSVYKHAGLDS